MNVEGFTSKIQHELDYSQYQRRLHLNALRVGGFRGEEYRNILHARRQTRHLLAVIQRQNRTAKLEASSRQRHWSKIW
ncbi:hypothetical protein AUJ29_03055 [Candidatus Kuenenbacteria bacterium CG1_02_38_13]|uniref:Uncharacterized protein n=1 Tax=Candidatus Kuenenbacteria bacterium CG1_02_38_13 TaxID=1805235 RepID=A0A1J4U096_9BACT|nr:MAG: hypothetical protein AUJ29_03055 [Candidatus Kuenenbacteria bacterium CG1_02_38_13]